jgi:integrase
MPRRKGSRRRTWGVSRITDPRYPGLTARVAELRRGEDTLYLVWKWKGKRQQMRSLQQTHVDLGATEKEQLAAARALGLDALPEIWKQGKESVHVARASVAKQGELLTLGRLADLYELRGSLTAEENYRKEQAAKIRRIAEHVGTDKPVVSLSQSDVNTWITYRREPGEAKRKVRQSTIWGEVAALKIALNWAVSEKYADGTPLLGDNPLAKVRVEKEKQPRRPVADAERYAKLKAVARLVSPVFELALDLAAGTGHRIGAILGLRWQHVLFDPTEAAEAAKELDSAFGWTNTDFPFGGLHFYAERRANNKAHPHVAPMTEPVREAVERARSKQSAIAGAWLFADSRDPTKPLTRWQLNRWLREVERRAKVPHLKQGAWHPFRRGWATARKHFPHMDVAKLGGWVDVTTMEKCYQQADAQTIRAIIRAG